MMTEATTAEPMADPPKRRPGRKPGSPKPAGSGRKPGVPNRLTLDLKQVILDRGRPLELLCDIARGVKIRVGPQSGPGEPVFTYPSLEQRIAAATKLLAKVMPDMKALEVASDPDAPLFPPTHDADTVDGRRELAKAIVAALAKAVPEGGGVAIAGPGEAAVKFRDPDLAQHFGEPAAKLMPGDTFEIDGGKASIRYGETLPDGRERWAILRRDGVLMEVRIGRDAAEARARVLIEEGKL